MKFSVYFLLFIIVISLLFSSTFEYSPNHDAKHQNSPHTTHHKSRGGSHLTSSEKNSKPSKDGSKLTHTEHTTKTVTTKTGVSPPNPNMRNTVGDKYIKHTTTTWFPHSGYYSYGHHRRYESSVWGTVFTVFILGIVCLIGSVYLICYNERRAVKCTQYIDELRSTNVEEINSDVSTVNKEKLKSIHVVSGKKDIINNRTSQCK